MKYIFLISLFVISSGVAAVVNPATVQGNNTVSSFASEDTTTSGQIGAGNTTSGDFGAGNTTSGTLGGNNTTSGTFGGGNTTSGNVGGAPSVNIPKPDGTIAGIIVWFITLLNYIVMALLTGALMFFLYGIFVLMFVGGTNEESRSKGKKFMLWGIISLFVMVSVWGLVAILKTSFFGGGPLVGPRFNI